MPATVVTKVGRRPLHAAAANVANSGKGPGGDAPSIVHGLLDVDIKLRAGLGLNKGEAHHALKNPPRIGC